MMQKMQAIFNLPKKSVDVQETDDKDVKFGEKPNLLGKLGATFNI